jgi:NAD(P)-dependent dehydrogenase (short-subunit alcohol dehydrogenase family)
MFDALAGEAKAPLFESLAARLPAGRIAMPADTAAAYIYAMQSDFTAGETLHIDGGQRLIQQPP